MSDQSVEAGLLGHSSHNNFKITPNNYQRVSSIKNSVKIKEFLKKLENKLVKSKLLDKNLEEKLSQAVENSDNADDLNSQRNNDVLFKMKEKIMIMANQEKQ